MTDNPEMIPEAALVQFLKPIKNIPFELVIQALCESEVKKFDLNIDNNATIFADIVDSMREVCYTVQDNPIQRSRPNEVGNDIEPFVMQALNRRGLPATRPKTKSGKGKTTGYSDIRIDIDGVPIYIEVKTYSMATQRSTMRSFYFSPSKNHKVADSGYHLAVGFQIEQTEDRFWPVAFKLVDLYGLECDMKAEFNSNNLRLYSEDRILASERIG